MGFATRLVSVLVLLAGWQVAASAAGSRLLPAPLAILGFIAANSRPAICGGMSGSR